MDNLLMLILCSMIGMLVGIISGYLACSSPKIKIRQKILGELYCYYSTQLGHNEYINSIKNSKNHKRLSSDDRDLIAREEDKLKKTELKINQLKSMISKQHICLIPKVGIPIYWPSLASGLSMIIILAFLCSFALK